MQESNRRQGGPEVRLLVATIVISAVALLLLARLRFPQAPPTPELPVTPPLERLAASATYDELARIVGTVQSRIAPSLLPLRLARRPVTEAQLEYPDALAATVAPGMTTAIRLSDTTAVVYLPPGTSPSDRPLTGGQPVQVAAVDEIRGLALLTVPHGPAIVPRSSRNAMVDLPAYLAVGEPTAAGAALRPVFVARADPRADAGWGTTVYSLGIQPAAPGSPLFTLGGEFVGLLVPGDEGVALLPAVELMAAVSRLERSGSIRRGHPGFSVQPLTPQLASATGAARGVVVALVDPSGPAAGSLRVGDVIEAVGEIALSDVDAFLTAVAAAAAGSTLVLTTVRGGARSQVTITPGEPAAEDPGRGLGLTLRTLRDVGAEVVLVTPGGAASRAGLRAGDILTHLNGAEHPTAAEIERAWNSARVPLLLGVRRGAEPLVLALSPRTAAD
jgi:S1-C subfamily serine protease